MGGYIGVLISGPILLMFADKKYTPGALGPFAVPHSGPFIATLLVLQPLTKIKKD